MDKLTPFCLATTLLAVATPAALAGNATNSPLDCQESGDTIQLMGSSDPSTKTEIFRWEKNIFPGDSAENLCEQTIENLTAAVSYGEVGEENFYLRIAKNAGVNNLCLATIDSECRRILFELLPNQTQPVEAYLKRKYSVASATDERGFERGSYRVRSRFLFWQQ
ncbi:MAG: hypothetical protein F6J96_00865 [Symploca sp. SIO1C2]|nr:hypothetical protein [Symploca sp. SIO1C2]